jgi:hypothetical protein
MKIQVVGPDDSRLGRYLKGLRKGTVSRAAWELMERGLLAVSLEATVERAISASLASASIVASVEPVAGDGEEDPVAAAAADAALGDWF